MLSLYSSIHTFSCSHIWRQTMMRAQPSCSEAFSASFPFAHPPHSLTSTPVPCPVVLRGKRAEQIEDWAESHPLTPTTREQAWIERMQIPVRDGGLFPRQGGHRLNMAPGWFWFGSCAALDLGLLCLQLTGEERNVRALLGVHRQLRGQRLPHW